MVKGSWRDGGDERVPGTPKDYTQGAVWPMQSSAPGSQRLRGSAVRVRQAQKWAGPDIAGAPGETEKAVDRTPPSPHQPRPKAPAQGVREKGPEREVLN